MVKAAAPNGLTDLPVLLLESTRRPRLKSTSDQRRPAISSRRQPVSAHKRAILIAFTLAPSASSASNALPRRFTSSSVRKRSRRLSVLRTAARSQRLFGTSPRLAAKLNTADRCRAAPGVGVPSLAGEQNPIPLAQHRYRRGLWPLPPSPPRKTLVKFGPPPRALGRDNRTRAGGRQADAEVSVHGALQGAASVAGLLITTICFAANDTADQAAGHNATGLTDR